MRALCLPSAAIFFSVVAGAFATPVDPTNFSESIYVTSPDIGRITGIDWAPDGSGRLFVIRKQGFELTGTHPAEARIVQNGSVLPTVFATETVFNNSECGLIGMCFDPDFVNNHYVYFFVTISQSQQQIVRYTDSNGVGINRTVIVPGLPTSGHQHNGGAVGIGNDGKLYWAIGDTGNFTGVDADLASLAAKVGRANRNGTVPNDNPFFDGADPNNDYIWARGFRNPFTFTFQRSTGQLWSNTVGTNWEQVFVPTRGSHAGYNDYENNQPSLGPSPAPYLPPIIAYRTNLTEPYTIALNGAVRSNGVVTFPVSAPLMQKIEAALAEALRRESDWSEWGNINRSIFEQRYREHTRNHSLADTVLSLLPRHA